MPARLQVLDVLRSQPLRPQVLEATLGYLIRHQRQEAIAIVLGLERVIAVAPAQLLEVVIEVPHGFRSTFRDWAAERTAFPAEMAELALAPQVQHLRTDSAGC